MAHDPEKWVPVFRRDHAQTNEASMANEPKARWQRAGASNAPPPWSDSTVVVIDAQREYTDGKLPLTNVQPALDEIGKLLKRARALQIPVIHIQHQGKAGG